MNRKRPALGRGLGALLPESKPAPAPSEATPAPARVTGHPRMLSIERLQRNPDQPRKLFDPTALSELAASIQVHGILQPIVVTPGPNDKFIIIAGERRWRAAQMCGRHEVPVVIRDTKKDERLELALIENIQRAELNAIEEAKAYQELIDSHKYSQEALAKRVGKERSSITNALRLLKLPERVQDMVIANELQMGHARALLGLGEDAAMIDLAAEIVRRKMSVRATEKAVRDRLVPPVRDGGQDSGPPDRRKVIIDDLEQRLRRSLGVKARLRPGSKPDGPGRIELPYSNLDELNRLLQSLITRAEN